MELNSQDVTMSLHLIQSSRRNEIALGLAYEPSTHSRCLNDSVISMGPAPFIVILIINIVVNGISGLLG